MKKRILGLVAGLALLIGVAVTGRSQVVLIERTTSPGFGGKFGFEVLDTTAVQGDARRVGHAVRFTGSIMRHLGTKRQIRIVRLDKELLYLLDPETRTYSEIPFSEVRDRLSGLNTPEDSEGEPEPAGEEVEEVEQSEYDWEEPTFSAKDLAEEAKVNGWEAHHWLLAMETVGTHRETGIKDTLRFEDDLWLSQTAEAQLGELRDFDRRWVKALGFEPEEDALTFGFLKAYRKQFEELRREAAKLKGYPVRYTYRLVATNHVAEERREKQEAERGSGDQEGSELSKGNLKGAFGGFLKKKALKTLKAKRKKQAKKPGKNVVFQMTGDVVSIEESTLGPARFEVPEGYRLKS